jgi:DNA ligase-1
MAEKMVARSVIKALNLDKAFFIKEYNKIGDLGKTVEEFKKHFKSFDERDLNIIKVYEALYEMAKKTGPGSQEAKINILAGLIGTLDPLSARYLVRIPTGTMRLGFSDMTVLDALSWMVGGNKNLRPTIEAAYHVRPDLGFISRQIKEKGVAGIKKVKPQLFTPIIMMRAERLSSGAEIIDKIGACSVEPKYDGFRLQAHYKKGEGVRLYTRNLEDASAMYPDIIEAIKKQITAHEVIFEGEAIGYDRSTGNFLPFQETVQRKRKYDIEEMARKIPLKFFVFELLYVDGKSYLEVKFQERRKILQKIVKSGHIETHDTIAVARDEIVDDPKKLDLLFDEAVSMGLEGLIAKKLTGVYQPGARASNWIKFKRSYSAKIQDTIDCLVMGYDFGRGKRTDFGIGAFLAGVYDKKHDKFVTVAKIGTGLTDKEWRELKMRCQKIKTKTKPALYEVDKNMGVDVWVSPALVVEIKADEITKSPIHTAGLALRFPRLERFRDDKKIDDATDLSEVKDMFEARKIKS